MDENIQIELSKDEAIVLFDLLSRFSDEKKLEIVNDSENRVLWGLLCDLEKALAEPFQENYAEILEAARQKIRHEA